MNYTKGEWHLDTLTGEVKANGGRIAKVYGATEFNHTSNADECMANARLILSAPEMYRLLQEWYEDDLEYGIPDKTRHERMKAMFKAIDPAFISLEAEHE